MPEDHPMTEKEAAVRVASLAARFRKPSSEAPPVQLGGLVGEVMRECGFIEEKAEKLGG